MAPERKVYSIYVQQSSCILVYLASVTGPVLLVCKRFPPSDRPILALELLSRHTKGEGLTFLSI